MIRKAIERLRRDEEGVTAVEYGLIAVLTTLVIIGGVQAYVSSTSKMLNNVGNAINTAVTP